MPQPRISEEIGIRRSEPASLYVNYFEVAHNQFEFLLELGQFRPSDAQSGGDLSIHTRLAISPPYTKMLCQLLTQAVKEHEAEYGTIPALGEQGPGFDIVLRSLPEEYEERARELRSLSSNGAGTSRDRRDSGRERRRPNRPKKDR